MGVIQTPVSRFNLEHNSLIYQGHINFNFPEDLANQKLLAHTKKIRKCGKYIDDRIIAKL